MVMMMMMIHIMVKSVRIKLINWSLILLLILCQPNLECWWVACSAVIIVFLISITTVRIIISAE